MPPIELDKDLAATLTDEELAAIGESEHSPEELDAIKSIAGETIDDDEDDEDGDDEVIGDGSPVEGSGASGEAGDDNPGEAPADVPEEEPSEFKTQYKAYVPADLEEQIAAVASEKKDLAQKFRDGDIDLDEFNTQSEALEAKRDDLNKIKLKAEVFEDMNAQTGQQAWANAVNTFVNSVAKAEGIDYRKDAEKAGDLDIFVKRLADNPANEGKPMNWFLQEAHKRVRALHGIESTNQATRETDADKLKAARERRKPPVDAAPKTLAQVPGSDGPGDVSGEFSDIDGLEGMELEDAIARMTPSQRERYLKA